MMPSAIGERQILPKQTMRIFISIRLTEPEVSSFGPVHFALQGLFLQLMSFVVHLFSSANPDLYFGQPSFVDE